LSYGGPRPRQIVQNLPVRLHGRVRCGRAGAGSAPLLVRLVRAIVPTVASGTLADARASFGAQEVTPDSGARVVDVRTNYQTRTKNTVYKNHIYITAKISQS
jgi:hypothetical protein